MERIAGEADLRRTLGTLRYLTGLQAEHSAASSESAGPCGSKPELDVKPDKQEAASSAAAADAPALPKAQASPQVCPGCRCCCCAPSFSASLVCAHTWWLSISSAKLVCEVHVTMSGTRTLSSAGQRAGVSDLPRHAVDGSDGHAVWAHALLLLLHAPV